VSDVSRGSTTGTKASRSRLGLAAAGLALALGAGIRRASTMSRHGGGIRAQELIVAGTVIALGALLVAAPALAGRAKTKLVSVSRAGAGANDHSVFPSISADGRFIAFESDASNLVVGDTNFAADVFVRDLGSGKTRRVSVRTNSDEHRGDSRNPSISAGGRFVAFRSSASLVRAATNRHNEIFLRDLKTGRTRRVSLGMNRAQPNASSASGTISAGGRFVAFQSGATNLVDGDTNDTRDIFVRDLETGTTRRVSVSTNGQEANGPSGSAGISASGRLVAFFSRATNLVRGDTNDEADVFVHNLRTGTTRRVSLASTGEQANDRSAHPTISAKGRRVAFVSAATNLAGGETTCRDCVFVRNLNTGTTRVVSVDLHGAEPFDCSSPSISADGSRLAFLSNVLPPGDSDPEVFIHDLKTGGTRRVTVGLNGVKANGDSHAPAISADGRFVAFWSNASNLVRGDRNDDADVFRRGPFR
jgi:Tol biopolymer transport system component